MDKYLYEHPDFLVVLAANNFGEYGSRTVAPPADAKNSVTTGALEMRDPVDDELLEDITVAWFSSQGPTRDGRIKPDIVAPGSVVKSVLASPLEWHLENQLSNNFDETYSDPLCSTTSMMGTSMSTPVVAGMRSPVITPQAFFD